MNRLDFIGLNSNEAACALLYVIAVLWVLNFAAKRIAAKVVLIIAEGFLVVLVAKTMSRGAVVALIGGLVCLWYWGRRARPSSTDTLVCASSHNPQKCGTDKSVCATLCRILRWFSYSPLWRLLLLLSSPGLWVRSSPAYVAQDASIGNRFELWKGAVKLIATEPLRGWGYTRTGASYMNWFQGVNDHTYYNGVVNSYLQIGAGLGLPVLFAVLAVLFAALLGTQRRVAQTFLSVPVFDRANFGTDRNVCATLFSLLSFIWILVWMVMSCFSSMMASPLLFIPPLVAVFVALFLHPPRRTEIIGSLLISFSVCLLIFSLGHRFAGDDSLSITRDSNGMVTVANNGIKTGKTCVIFVDESVLGEGFGKEVRKFMAGSDFDACRVAQAFLSVPKPEDLITGTDRNVCATLIILSGITIDKVGIKDADAKYVLLNPSFLPQSLPAGQVEAVVYPEINRGHYIEPDAASLDKFQGRIRKVPFDENFEMSWAKYITQEIPNPEIPNPK